MRLPFIDQSGASRTLASFHGKVLVVSDAMTLCQETCPLDTANVVAAARAVTAAGLGDRIAFASITVDPQRDDRAKLAAYRGLFAPAPANWVLLTGSPDSVAALWRYLGVYYETVPETSPPASDWLTGRPLTYDVTHADLVFFIDENGHERFVIDGPAHVATGAAMPDALRRFLNDEGQRNLAQPDAQTWTVGQALQILGWLTGRSISNSPDLEGSFPALCGALPAGVRDLRRTAPPALCAWLRLLHSAWIRCTVGSSGSSTV
jgi:protein SCO1/2